MPEGATASGGGVQYHPLTLTGADLAAFSPADHATITFVLPAGAYYLGATIGEKSPVAFTSLAGAGFTADLALNAGSILNGAITVGPALPVGLNALPNTASGGGVVSVGMPIGGQTIALTVTTDGADIGLALTGSITGIILFTVPALSP